MNDGQPFLVRVGGGVPVSAWQQSPPDSSVYPFGLNVAVRQNVGRGQVGGAGQSQPQGEGVVKLQRCFARLRGPGGSIADVVCS